ncbi:uncharacterized protein [Panulirus ornatus]|uniref:uncharacterized protein n=1 Tax=Panulirus ornatus TaxID=150431 RepID=UPI003A847EAD
MERRNWWPVLSLLGLGWLAATSVTALGMYMVACHANALPHLTQQLQEAKKVVSSGKCVGSWTIGAGHLVLVVGSLLNLLLLVTMLVLLVRERLALTVSPDPPPDYDSLIKSETPPPSFAEVLLRQQGRPVPAPCPPAYTPLKPEDTGTPSSPAVTTAPIISLPTTMV